MIKQKNKLTGGNSISAVGVSYSSVPSYGTLRSWTGGVGAGAPLVCFGALDLSIGPVTTPACTIFISQIWSFNEINKPVYTNSCV